MTPKLANTDQKILSCFAVTQQLRPKLKKEEFLATIRDLQTGGYQLLFLEDDKEVVALAGFRISQNLFMGKHLYVDDLVTHDQHRSKGHGKTLINWLKQHAKNQHCEIIHLDSGVQRHQAHKFYLNQNFDIASYHFSQTIK